MKLSLYYSPWCPFCVRVVNALKRMSVKVELRDTGDRNFLLQLKNGGGKTQVPCLLIDNGGQKQWLYESDDIITYLKAL